MWKKKIRSIHIGTYVTVLDFSDIKLVFLSGTGESVGLPRRLMQSSTIGQTHEVNGLHKSSFWYDFLELSLLTFFFIFTNNFCGAQQPIFIIIHNINLNKIANACFQNYMSYGDFKIYRGELLLIQYYIIKHLKLQIIQKNGRYTGENAGI